MPVHSRISIVFAGLLACAWASETHSQSGSPSAPGSVDDIIAKILRDQPTFSTQGQPRATTGRKPKSSNQLPIVMSVHIGDHSDRTRFVVELSDPLNLRTFALNNPNRIVVDLPAVQWHLDGPPRPTGHGAILSYRYGLFRPDNSRFVIDLNQPVSISDALVIPPENGFGYRVVIDLFPTSQAKFDQTSGWPADLKAREAAAEQVASLPETARVPVPGIRKTIVIDPGHGGIDSGTSGANGLLERDLVLDVGLRVAEALRRNPKCAIYMTRSTDMFVPLRERINIARAHHADLFISIHADSNPNSDVTGLSVYTLSESGSDKEAAALARKENQSDVIAGVDLGGDNAAVAPILLDLEQRDTMNKSSRFARLALNSLSGATDILPRQPHRSAAFVVLKAPDVPSVLIELGYLSNSKDAAQMNTARWRDKVADAIASAAQRQFAPATASAPNSMVPISE